MEDELDPDEDPLAPAVAPRRAAGITLADGRLLGPGAQPRRHSSESNGSDGYIKDREVSKPLEQVRRKVRMVQTPTASEGTASPQVGRV